MDKINKEAFDAKRKAFEITSALRSNKTENVVVYNPLPSLIVYICQILEVPPGTAIRMGGNKLTISLVVGSGGILFEWETVTSFPEEVLRQVA